MFYLENTHLGKIAKDQGIFMTNHGKKGMNHGNFADHYGKSFDQAYMSSEKRQIKNFRHRLK